MSNKKTKRYGEPYARIKELNYGDYKIIAQVTKYKKVTIAQMMNGFRRMQPIVEQVANQLADENRIKVEKYSNNQI